MKTLVICSSLDVDILSRLLESYPHSPRFYIWHQPETPSDEMQCSNDITTLSSTVSSKTFQNISAVFKSVLSSTKFVSMMLLMRQGRLERSSHGVAVKYKICQVEFWEDITRKNLILFTIFFYAYRLNFASLYHCYLCFIACECNFCVYFCPRSCKCDLV